MRGRKPKPTELKRRAGNPGKRRLNDREPRPARPPVLCAPPAHLTAHAKKAWQEIGTVLVETRVLTRADLKALEACCQIYGRWVEAEQELKESSLLLRTKNNYPMINPLLILSDKLLKQLRAYLTEFGLTPSSRTRIVAGGAEDAENTRAEITRQLLSVIPGGAR